MTDPAASDAPSHPSPSDGAAEGLTILGSTVRHPVEHLETFPAPAGCTKVRFTCEEVTSMCPVTEQPDLSTVVIEYVPHQRCIESKSLKLYLWSFRDAAVFAEQMAVDIATEVHRATACTSVEVHVAQRARGGIETETFAQLP